jgi:hypothetical protein
MTVFAQLMKALQMESISYFGIFQFRIQHLGMELARDRQKKLREVLKAARLAAGLRQVDLSSALSRPQSFVAKVESGERKLDFIEVLDLCAVIGLDPADLVRKLT